MTELSLPKVTLPIFTVHLPSTGEEIQMRPFITKEEKILLMALESDNTDEQSLAIKQVVQNCIVEWPKTYSTLDEMPYVDFEFLFLELRKRSIGEQIFVFFDPIQNSECEECSKIRKIEIDLTEVHPKNDLTKEDMTILVVDDIGVKLKLLTVKDLKELETIKKQEGVSDIDVLFEVVARTVESMFTPEKVIPITKNDLGQIKGWLEELPIDTFQKIKEVVARMPKIEHTIEISCSKCDFKQYYTFEGMYSFFV